TFAIIGGTGRIGTAIATHLLLRSPKDSQFEILLIGRDQVRGFNAVEEVLLDADSAGSGLKGDHQVIYQCADWRNQNDLRKIASMADCLIHTAGPFLGEDPSPLREAIASTRCKVYVDVSDPLDFINASLDMNNDAKHCGTSALLASGAFPGLSNVLAMEAASCLDEDDKVKDLRFNYFTAGLGGSGDINLYITNIGFGEPMAQFERGALRLYEQLSGLLLGKVNFFLDEENSQNIRKGSGNTEAKKRIGTQTVFSWPFPEAATVAQHLKVSGESSAAMGTAPDIWNTMLGILVNIVPRAWWRSKAFSKFMADFSQPLVKATDLLLKQTSQDNVGETHAMRVDVIGESGTAISCVQAHESFRRCVGQSCAEFALDLMDNPSPGVQLPEQRYADPSLRKQIIKRLTSTPGTIAFTGAAIVEAAPSPTGLKKALQQAGEMESKLSQKHWW
ncbi:unnamed protein product, partial [Heterosigma akashiwo]